MALFKCKMCGGNLEIAEGVTVTECEYCGAKQTVPKVMDENLQNLFNRANTLRIKSEFDKAEKLYEKIVEADSTQAEAYWGLILCKYGIEYVDDPKTYKKIPTCHRASYDSIIADEDYKSALENADISQKVLYEEQAKEIDRIQKEILALAQKEESYDVFICYKETDANGQRTQDSVNANDIYYQLTNEGFKVFYAAITLEGKLGSAYEPIIFAALNSAKVMLAIGSKPEYFNAVWVKNEWSRFLKIIKKDRSKLLIPCYRDMDAYELPEEFAHLQAQDMSKIGFINDLVRGIKKVIQKDEPKVTTVVKETVVSNGNANAAPLLKRAFIFLEDGDWNSANEYCEKVLDIDPENARAYLGKLMVELNVRKQEDLKNCDQPFGGYSNCQKAVRFADDRLKSEIVGYIEFINNRNEEARLKRVYNEAKRIINLAEKHYDYKSAQSLLESIPGYLDADELAKDCAQKAEEARIREAEEKKQAFERAEVKRKDDIIANAKTQMKSELIPNLESAIAMLRPISGWRNASELIEECENKIKNLKAIMEAERKAEALKAKIKVVTKIIIGIVIVVGGLVGLYFLAQWLAFTPDNDAYSIAVGAAFILAILITIIVKISTGDGGCGMFIITYIVLALVLYGLVFGSKMLFIKEVDDLYTPEIVQSYSGSYYTNGVSGEATVTILSCDESGDVSGTFEFVTEGVYGKYEVSGSITSKKNNGELILSLSPGQWIIQPEDYITLETMEITISEDYQSFDCSQYRMYWSPGVYEGNVIENAEDKYNAAVDLMDNGEYEEAIAIFKEIEGYSDSNSKLQECSYNIAIPLMNEGKYTEAISFFMIAEGYNDSNALIKECAKHPRGETVSVYRHTLGLKTDGTVDVVGWNLYNQCNVSDWKDIVAVSAGYDHSVGLKTNGKVVAAGKNKNGQCNVSDWKDIVAVSTGQYYTVGLKADGTVVATGYNEYGQCEVSEWTDIVAISAGQYHTVGLKADGTVVAVGSDENGKCEVSGWSDIISISAGLHHTVGLKADGTVVAVGYKGHEQCDVEEFSDIISISAGEIHTVGLKSDGTVVAVGGDSNGYGCEVSEWTDIVAISAGEFCTVGLKADGTVVAVGNNFYGQCNVDDWNDILVR